jgi:Fe-S cluster biogenesis protein NfuA/nitrite reductase/ring-hydroxylating ferredoxin subunit
VTELSDKQIARVEKTLAELEEGGQAEAIEAVEAIVELYGEGLARIAKRVGEGTLKDLAEDDLVAHLLLLHGLHPVDCETRVRAALEEVRPYLGSHGGDVELVGVEGGSVRLRLQGTCDGCPSSQTTLKLAVEDAIYKAAPEIEHIEAEGALPAQAVTGVALSLAEGGVPDGALALPLAEGTPGNGGDDVVRPGVHQGGQVPSGAERWKVVGSLPQLAGGGTILKEVDDQPVLFMAVEGTFFAYQHLCPHCGSSLEGGTLTGCELACPGCQNRFEAHRAGRCVDRPGLRLEPVPLLVADSGIVKVAVT